MLHFLSIDIGGSKTEAVVFDDNFNVLNSAETVGVGSAEDSSEDIPFFREFLISLAEGYEICSVGVNLGGKNKNQITKIVAECFPESVVSVFRESEGDASKAFGRKYGADAVLLAGTGTIITAYTPDERTAIGGGWGMNIGDGGSGYYIGLEAIKRSLAALDKTEPLTPLQKEITGHSEPFAAQNAGDICLLRDEVRARIYPLERRHIASYAKLVSEFAKRGEKDALLIMEDAGREMAKLTVGCVKKLLPYEAKKIAVSGGLIKSLEFWQNEFEEYIRQNSSITEFVYQNKGILTGTQVITVEQMEG